MLFFFFVVRLIEKWAKFEQNKQFPNWTHVPKQQPRKKSGSSKANKTNLSDCTGEIWRAPREKRRRKKIILIRSVVVCIILFVHCRTCVSRSICMLSVWIFCKMQQTNFQVLAAHGSQFATISYRWVWTLNWMTSGTVFILSFVGRWICDYYFQWVYL